MTGPMKRLALALALLATTTTLPGCMIALGSSFENDHKPEIDDLERRLSTAEVQLGISQPPVR